MEIKYLFFKDVKYETKGHLRHISDMEYK